jgi:hypothetical protein
MGTASLGNSQGIMSTVLARKSAVPIPTFGDTSSLFESRPCAGEPDRGNRGVETLFDKRTRSAWDASRFVFAPKPGVLFGTRRGRESFSGSDAVGPASRAGPSWETDAPGKGVPLGSRDLLPTECLDGARSGNMPCLEGDLQCVLLLEFLRLRPGALCCRLCPSSLRIDRRISSTSWWTMPGTATSAARFRKIFAEAHEPSETRRFKSRIKTPSGSQTSLLNRPS